MNLILYTHLVAEVLALVIGAVVFFQDKGTERHKKLGKIYAVLMVGASFIAFGMQKDGAYGWLHVLAAFTIYNVVQGYRAARAKEMRAHQSNMIVAYFSSLVAFVFAVHPDRFIGQWIERLLGH